MMAYAAISTAQDFLPVLSDNYMGVNQAFLQPASIADSRFKSDFNVGGFSNDISNTGIRFRSKWLLDPAGILIHESWWDENTYLDEENGKDKNMFMSQSAIGPSLMISMGPKHAFAITSRVRSITNADGMDEPLFRMIYSNYGTESSDNWNKWYYDENMRAVQHIFGDYGITYARVFYDQREHFVKAGATLKLLQGIASSYLQTDQLYYYYDGQEPTSAKPISWNSPYVHGGLSDNWGEFNEDGSYFFSMNYQLTAKPSVGLDFGIVYEYRPRWMEYNNPKNGNPRKDVNKYFIKAGISLVDLGRLKYTKDYNSTDLITAFTPDYVARYNSSDNSIPVNTYWMDAGMVDFRFRKYVPFADTMYRRYSADPPLGVYKAKDNQEQYKIKLPTALSCQVDVHLIKGLYVNLTTYTALNQSFNKAPNNHYISSYSVTPRYEHKWYSLAVPVQVNQYGKFEVGLGVRAGIVYFGVNNLFSNVFEDPYGIHAYVGVKIPVHHKKDKVIIPDTIKPSVLIDHYPVKRKDDGEKDRINIIEDSFNNYYIDDHSVNINQSGQGGGIPSAFPGTIVPGPATNGTVIPQPTDGGGVKPGGTNPGGGGPGTGRTPGGGGKGPGGKGLDLLPKNSHIPDKITSIKINDQEFEVKPVYFAFGTSKNSRENNDYLDSLASVLKSRTDLTVTIEGHTDNVGSEDFNMKLSQIRAEETRNYLIQRGVNADQLAIEWFGESKPIDDATKDTIEGRNRNRRVEFRVESRS